MKGTRGRLSEPVFMMRGISQPHTAGFKHGCGRSRLCYIPTYRHLASKVVARRPPILLSRARASLWTNKVFVCQMLLPLWAKSGEGQVSRQRPSLWRNHSQDHNKQINATLDSNKPREQWFSNFIISDSIWKVWSHLDPESKNEKKLKIQLTQWNINFIIKTY